MGGELQQKTPITCAEQVTPPPLPPPTGAFLLQIKVLNDQRREDTITLVVFPSGPWSCRSTSHSRQCSGAPPTGCSQAITSESGPARTSTFSVVGGLTRKTMTKTIAGWGKLLRKNGSPFDVEHSAYCGFGFAERWTWLAKAPPGKSHLHRCWRP